MAIIALLARATMFGKWASWLLPYGSLALQTRLAPGSVRLRLHDVLDQGNATEPGLLGLLGYPPGTYKGIEQDGIFHLFSANYGSQKVVHLRGAIEGDNSGSMIRISVRFTASRYVATFLPICFLIGYAWFVVQNVNAWQNGVACCTILSFGWYAFSLVDFWGQVARDKQVLEELLGADERQP